MSDMEVRIGLAGAFPWVVLDDNGGAVDITNWTIKCAVTDNEGTLMFELTNGSGITITDGVTGKFKIEPSVANTTLLSAQTYAWEIAYKDGSDEPRFLAEGRMVAKITGVTAFT